MKKFLLFLLMFLIMQTAQATVLEAGVSVNEIPKEFFGSWRVKGVLEKSNSFSIFKPQSMDFWTLSRVGERVVLDNPFSGAKAEIAIQSIEGNLVVFTKKQAYDDNKILIDTVTLRLSEKEFSGINTLTLETFSLIDNHLMKAETAIYKINGEKLSDEKIENK